MVVVVELVAVYVNLLVLVVVLAVLVVQQVNQTDDGKVKEVVIPGTLVAVVAAVQVAVEVV